MYDENVRFIRLPEIVIPGKRTGRHVVHDQRSKDHVAELAPKIISVTHNALGLPLQQAAVGSCTAESCTGAGNSQPNLKAGAKPRTQKDAYHLYAIETQQEGQPWPPNDPGGSGLAVCKAAKSLKWITSYTHAFGIDQALRALVLRPVITGVSWMTSFDSPDSNGLVSIAAGATVRGGHEILADEIIAEHELVGFWNSWGPSFGLGGRFYMSFSTWDTLLKEQGDVTIPVFP